MDDDELGVFTALNEIDINLKRLQVLSLKLPESVYNNTQSALDNLVDCFMEDINR